MCGVAGFICERSVSPIFARCVVRCSKWWKSNFGPLSLLLVTSARDWMFTATTREYHQEEDKENRRQQTLHAPHRLFSFFDWRRWASRRRRSCHISRRMVSFVCCFAPFLRDCLRHFFRSTYQWVRVKITVVRAHQMVTVTMTLNLIEIIRAIRAMELKSSFSKNSAWSKITITKWKMWCGLRSSCDANCICRKSRRRRVMRNSSLPKRRGTCHRKLSGKTLYTYGWRHVTSKENF